MEKRDNFHTTSYNLFRALIVSVGYLWDNDIDHTISCPGGGVLGYLG